MVSCLTLLNSTHVLAGHVEGLNHTLCGLAIAEADTQPGLIASVPGAATCQRCQSMLHVGAMSHVAQERPLDTRTLVKRLIDRLNANDSTHLEKMLDGPLLGALSSQRLGRLHELFPGWHATVDELIAEEGSAVLRYQVSCSDAFGLLGCIGPSVKTGQAVVLRLANHRITDACPIVDDFAFWSGLAKTSDAACAHCTSNFNSAKGSSRDNHYS
ncbi:nuclear transport factor 2 family protein [Variovorax terrae]|uniref:Uncharacterized protein n=1 Tax=Variovorax terrae TaxID=2923278 RepID=A0A9X1W2L4_9BURK|nr:nuclear transport factor 2 family protein [Variovorax terrae]MCJ0764918.1 hypothetical protein [Variovorax terrae]